VVSYHDAYRLADLIAEWTAVLSPDIPGDSCMPLAFFGPTVTRSTGKPIDAEIELSPRVSLQHCGSRNVTVLQRAAKPISNGRGRLADASAKRYLRTTLYSTGKVKWLSGVSMLHL
jgi:hypothetical protein